MIAALELIKGLGQYRAGRGAVVTGWQPSAAKARAEYYRMAKAAV